ncbi:MAG: dihydrolipoamide acetyltransferase family protein [Bdellovibrionota bacterium]
MKTEMMMPQMGESIAEATILKWLKGVGDSVEKDETILEISTDKVDSEIPAPASGVIVELVAKQGDTVPVKSVIAIIETDASAAKSAGSKAAPAKAAPEPAKPAAKAAAPEPKKAAPEPVPAVEGDEQYGDRFYSPLVKSLAQQHGLSASELAQIQGSGAQGRVNKTDVLSYIESRGRGTGVASPAAPRAASPLPPPTARPEFDQSGVRVEPFDKMRKIIAEHMVRSKATSPHVYSMAEVDVTNIALYREANQKTFLGREGFKLSFTPFFLEAIIKALIQFPRVNASVEGDNLILKKHVNLGCAVALGQGGTEGLIVPVIKNADQLNLTGIASALNDLAQRARNKKLAPDDIQGGTFTVTNPGIFGNIMGCPIINQPQLAILGIGAIKKRVMVVNDMIAIRDMVYLTLTYDHRVIDGALGGQFLSFVTKYLESWDMNRAI